MASAGLPTNRLLAHTGVGQHRHKKRLRGLVFHVREETPVTPQEIHEWACLGGGVW